MYQVKVNQRDLEWNALELPGVSMKILYKDEASGAMAVLTRIQAGASIPKHLHTEDGESFGPGTYFACRAGVPHGPHETVRGCTVLTHFSAHLDFQPA